MRCSSCGAENLEGLKFCNECAAPFKRRCPSCGFENTPTAKFCGECAAPLNAPHRRLDPASASSPPAVRIAAQVDSQTTMEGERKTVSALFADIKGSMDLMEDLDPEEARTIVDPALRLMIDAVHRYDGYIVQSTGDGIFALFGAPVAHEDHPLRALHAALRMQEDMRRYAERLRARQGHQLAGAGRRQHR
jgi:class 3 adenylate cyclase